MSKVITFSRHFQKSHPKAGQPTRFVEKLVESFNDLGCYKEEEDIEDGDFSLYEMIIQFPDFNFQKENIWRKHHTIRGGNRFKVGDKFSPRVWSGKPYASKQIIISPDIEVKQTWEFSFDGDWFFLNKSIVYELKLSEIAGNDGLSLNDFKAWFPKPFVGQIICWSDDVCY